MITEKELDQYIEHCLQEPVTSNKRNILADLIIIKNYLFGEPIQSGYSYANKVENIIYTNSDTEFLATVNGKDTEKVMAIMDELMEATKTLHPRMYDRVIEKINDI